MATTTPNFGWSVPTSTDLVKDGATAIETLGDAIDASLVDLKGGTTGQVLAKASATDMDFSWVAQDDSNAIQNAIVDAKGDLIAATANDTPARLAVGANDTVLTADSTAATGLKWATPASGGMTLITSGTLSGATVTLSSIPTTYNNLQLVLTSARPSNSGVTTSMEPNTTNTAGFYIGYNSSGTLVGTNVNGMELNPSGGYSTSNTSAVHIATFYDYARATTSRLAVMNGRYDTGSTNITFTSTTQLVGTAAAMTSLAIKSNSTWSAGNYYLYGVK